MTPVFQTKKNPNLQSCVQGGEKGFKQVTLLREAVARGVSWRCNGSKWWDNVAMARGTELEEEKRAQREERRWVITMVALLSGTQIGAQVWSIKIKIVTQFDRWAYGLECQMVIFVLRSSIRAGYRHNDKLSFSSLD